MTEDEMIRNILDDLMVILILHEVDKAVKMKTTTDPCNYCNQRESCKKYSYVDKDYIDPTAEWPKWDNKIEEEK